MGVAVAGVAQSFAYVPLAALLRRAFDVILPARDVDALLHGRLTSQTPRRMRRQRRLGRQRPLTILRGKKTGHNSGSGTVAWTAPPGRAG